MAKKAVDATQNATYQIGTVGVHNFPGRTLGALYAAGSTAAECIHCVKTGQKLTLSNIPRVLQETFGIGATAVATFKESGPYHTDDVLDFGNGKRVQFRAFADRGIEAYIGLKHDTGKAVGEIMTTAIAGAADKAGTEEGGAPARELENV